MEAGICLPGQLWRVKQTPSVPSDVRRGRITKEKKDPQKWATRQLWEVLGVPFRTKLSSDLIQSCFCCGVATTAGVR